MTWDEDDHLYAGYMSWKTSDFGLNPEHPPMVKMLAALPILNMPLRMPALQNREFKHEASWAARNSCSRTMRIRCYSGHVWPRPA